MNIEINTLNLFKEELPSMIKIKKGRIQPKVANKKLTSQEKGKEKGALKRMITINESTLQQEEKDASYFNHLASIVEYLDDAIISKSLNGTINSWNKGGEKMFGYTAKQVIGKNISILIPSAYVNDEKKILERILNNKTVDRCKTVRLKKNGEQVQVSIKASPLKDNTRGIIGVSEIVRDITPRKQIDNQISYADKELAFQSKGKIKREDELILVNKKLAFQNHEKEKRTAKLIIANKELIFQNKEKEKLAEKLIIANKELAFQNKEKGKRAEELAIANKELAFQNEEKGKRAKELAIAKELIQANSEIIDRTTKLEAVNKELEAFSYSVSHDLRAPLRAIHGYAKMLKTEYETQLDPEANRLMSNILSNAKKMGQLIDDLLTFSRIGRKDLVLMNISMHGMVTDFCNEIQNEQSQRIIEFHIGNLLPAQADNMTIKQVWLNLISNAVKYSKLKDKSIIEIGSESTDDEIIYSIKDNGAGFDMLYANKLFGVFQRLHSDEEFEGTGVGLALVQRIITKHGGRVWATGKVSEGAIFYFTLNKS